MCTNQMVAKRLVNFGILNSENGGRNEGKISSGAGQKWRQNLVRNRAKSVRNGVEMAAEMGAKSRLLSSENGSIISSEMVINGGRISSGVGQKWGQDFVRNGA